MIGARLVPSPGNPWPLDHQPCTGWRSAMAHYLSDEELTRTAPAETAAFASPVPTQIVSNGEFNPLPQSREQERVEARIKDLAERLPPPPGMDRRRFPPPHARIAPGCL